MPQEFTTLVAIPTLLLNEKQVRELIEDLEVRYLANQDPNIHFALLTDLPDSVSRPRPNDTDPLVDLAVRLINDLNARYAPARTGGGASTCCTGIASSMRGRACGWDGSASAASCST